MKQAPPSCRAGPGSQARADPNLRSAPHDPGPRDRPGATIGTGARVLILLARGWQLGPSVILPPSCRFQPSCSAYAITALRRYGALRGGWLAARRIARCHPWGGHGYDPVPEPVKRD